MDDRALADVRLHIANLSSMVTEVRDRARRTETRLTRYLLQAGLDAKTSQPRFDEATCTVHLPSMDCTMREAIDAVPQTLRHSTLTINVMVGASLIGVITLPAV